MSNSILLLAASQLKKAADIKEKIESLQEELASLVGAAAVSQVPAATGKKGRGKLSAAGLARIRAAQKARWAKIKGRKGGASAAPKKKKFTMSEAAKAAISKAAKARWAKIRAAKAK